MKKYAFFLIFFLYGCNSNSAQFIADAEIPKCASYFQNWFDRGKVYTIEVGKDCWKEFIEEFSKNERPWCTTLLMSGEGCEYTTKNGDFILSPLKNGDVGTKKFTLVGLRD
jgi:hypothetical protein